MVVFGQQRMLGTSGTEHLCRENNSVFVALTFHYFSSVPGWLDGVKISYARVLWLLKTCFFNCEAQVIVFGGCESHYGNLMAVVKRIMAVVKDIMVMWWTLLDTLPLD